jgi:hypothetical protein
MRFCLVNLFKTKVKKLPKVQMENFQGLIVDPNITHNLFRNILIGHFMTIIFLNY